MNWLAHALLSEEHPQARMGNVLADVVKGRQRRAMPEAFRRGVARHQRIDRYTDRHPVVWRSVERISPRFRRFAPILVDVFYDHCLAARWPRWVAFVRTVTPARSTTPAAPSADLSEFTTHLYADLHAASPHPCAEARHRLPEHARHLLDGMTRHDLLGSYATYAGIERALAAMSRRFEQRWNRRVGLDAAVDDLARHGDDFHADFQAFFPQLVAALHEQPAPALTPTFTPAFTPATTAPSPSIPRPATPCPAI